jgi:ubiquinol-cytochrome c reductase cytochrome b subunit
MKFLSSWLDHRTGYKKVLHEALFENVPGGARWRYVWGSTLTFTFIVQIITGIFLWMAYSPSSQTAWESVYYIQHGMTGGWLLRGIHHFTAQAMNILLVLHLMQVLIDGAYKAPREVNFWFGLLLLLLVLGLSLTGYLLPWDQKGFWATKVATNIMAITPFIGPQLQQLVLGGTEYGHHTLTRFFALHAGVLPGLMILLIGVHVYLFRRHGLTPRQPLRKPDAAFWPDQVLKDAVACLAVLAAVLFLIIRPRLFGMEPGPELGAPADASEPYSAARPEWYFLFLFQFLKYFPGGTEIWGAIIIPTLVIVVLFAMPFVGNWKLGHRFNIGFMGVMFVGIALLTVVAMLEDRREPAYQIAVQSAARDSARVKELAHARGIPPAGAVTLLRDDPFAQGPKIFARNCASCHRFDGNDAVGRKSKEPPSASDLKGFASRTWLKGLLNPEKVSSPAYFGGTKFKDGKMSKFVKKDLADMTPEQQADLNAIIAAVSAEAQLKAQHSIDQADSELIKRGSELLKKGSRCADCHQFHTKDEDATGPDLTGYGSREWLIGLITNPSHARYYGKRNDHMPAFGDEKILDTKSIGLVADWLRGEWFDAGEIATDSRPATPPKVASASPNRE